jgi:hypothetical protein
MKTKLLTLVIVVVLLLAGVQMTSAQPRPAIITFESSLNTVSMADAEAGAETTTLSWHTAGVTDEYKLVLHYYVLDGWELAFSPDGVPLEADGSRIVTVQHPLTFGAPTYLLSIVRSDSNKIVDQRTLTIPYDVSASATPEIDSLEADVDEIDPAELEAGTARVMLTWSVSNRPPTANLVFDQLLSDETATSVELPRLVMWVPSVAQGPVAPVYEADMESVALRLRVIDAVTDEVYAEETLTIPVMVEEPAATAPETEAGETDTGTDAGTSEETEADVTPGPDTSQPSSKIVVFTAEPATVTPGAAVTLTWDVQGADSVSITQTVPNVTATPVVVEAQSPKGTAEVFLPDYAAYSVIYTLTTPDGQTSAQASVAVHCPYTYFFGAGEGCPSGEAFDVGAVYQEFENGYMLWRSDTNDIYVLFDDGSARYFVEANYANLPDPALDEMPPLDRQSPSEGFGKVWANAAGIRDQLGWALDDEIGYNAAIQGVALTRDPRPSVSFYMTLPDDTVVGSGFGTWHSVP